MTNHESALSDLAALLAGTDASLTTSLRDILAAALQELIEAELTATIGAAPGERTPERIAQRNGHRPKLLSTPAGDVEVGIPKLRQGSFFPELLEPRRRIDRALWAVIMTAYITRVTRSSMLNVLSEDYIRTAHAKGLPNRAVIWIHALRNALIPVVTVVGLYLGILIGNSVLTEIVFNRPGLGKLIVGALSQRDYTMLQGLMVIYTFIIIIVNLITDLTYGLIDPRVKYS